MQIRHLEYLLALERERHFARAAAACNVSQPTLSAGLAALEEQLGSRLVERDRRFAGFTGEGQAVLPWARAMVAAHASMAAAASAARGALSGVLRLGAIPAAMPAVGLFARALHAAFPQISLDVRSLTSRRIEQELAALRLDAGLTYLDHEPPAHVVAGPLYRERPMVVVADGHRWHGEAAIDFARLLEAPLCLLHQGMQNRRILDQELARRGLAARPAATADSYVALLAMARHGGIATVMPDSYRALLPDWARTIPIAGDGYDSRVGLIVAAHEPRPPIPGAALTIAAALDLPAEFGRL